jgi:hypothetical protein
VTTTGQSPDVQRSNPIGPTQPRPSQGGGAPAATGSGGARPPSGTNPQPPRP